MFQNIFEVIGALEIKARLSLEDPSLLVVYFVLLSAKLQFLTE
jgi:hypothetical protein